MGSSFYFFWLDNSLEPTSDKKVAGDLWAVHGGGFYHNTKYLVAPSQLPEDLHWFKWEAYSTWISGIALFALIYYWEASTYLTSAAKAQIEPMFAVGGSLAIFCLCMDHL